VKGEAVHISRKEAGRRKKVEKIVKRKDYILLAGPVQSALSAFVQKGVTLPQEGKLRKKGERKRAI